MYNELVSKLSSRGANIIKVVDISQLSEQENRGYNTAIIIVVVLSPEYILRQSIENIVDNSEFVEKEHRADELAEWVADFLIAKGYGSLAQSERRLNDENFNVNSKTSLLPHKKLAILAGLGWIGKSNLLVTQEYGSALCMCTVLTNAPLPTENRPIMKSKCGKCTFCKDICPAGVIHGTTWEEGINRDLIVDVYHCDGCLKCLVNCCWTKKYAKKITRKQL